MEEMTKKFVELLLAENQKHNLMSRQTGPEDVERHIQDCRQVLEWVPCDRQEVVDIGSGAGFPGLILAIACPSSRVTLVEADLKKSSFLQQAARQLGLGNIRVIRERVETMGQDSQHRAGYDLCTSRAVAAMRVLLEYGMPLVKIGGMVLLWKGSNYLQEIEEAQPALKLLGGKIKAVHLYNLMGERDRAIVVVQKIAATPERFPRRIGVPAKKPL